MNRFCASFSTTGGVEFSLDTPITMRTPCAAARA